ncbi:hypothetical protein BX616_001836 [Lobosporangium transversale]|uniref:C2 domain-containing protein n=1 Tax=Lobosporangium transversale TaxID=64571 RepID=A0A1Y2GAI3_9FUNG|nr:C2 domain-containing protein [Lobosporangium transversale]KAF9917137.1 hypothetical protein BX616_001836 [Lobosporangium transversale]ORZ05562.1 C2 domain-containing protein [Lobosporangium transversale]|eukprot:XP_021877136.1 C2 domain-containing protein [Lobosporangium transversale]
MSVQITVHSAQDMADVESFGKNDPYVQISLNFADENAFEKTSTKKNAGKNAEWNETLRLGNYDPSEHHYLYVEVHDKEKLADAPIGFTAIPLQEVTSSSNSLRGRFNLYTTKGKEQGSISLTIHILQHGQQPPSSFNHPEIQGLSQIVIGHHKRIKRLQKREDLTDAATAAAGVALFAGAANFLGSHK